MKGLSQRLFCLVFTPFLVPYIPYLSSGRDYGAARDQSLLTSVFRWAPTRDERCPQRPPPPTQPAPRIIGSPYARLRSERTDLRGCARGNPRGAAKGAALWSSAWRPNGGATALVRRIFGVLQSMVPKRFIKYLGFENELGVANRASGRGDGARCGDL